MKRHNFKVAGLANNHTLDLPEQFKFTTDKLRDNNIQYNGAGLSKHEAEEPVRFLENNTEVIVLSLCWDFLLYHQKNPSNEVHIGLIKEEENIKTIQKLRADNPNATIILFLHWSFDLETLPFPMYRQWARDLIDAGLDLVVGCHSHCVQGGEKYKDGYIVYGLGNFFIPNSIYANGALVFPEFSRLELALEYDVVTKKAVCHWIMMDDDNNLSYINSEEFEDSETLKKYSPYQGMDNKEYEIFFRNKRRKKRLIPIYKDYNKSLVNKIYTIFLKSRAKFARYLASVNLVRWQS